MQGQLDDIQLVLTALIKWQVESSDRSPELEALLKEAKGSILDAAAQLESVQNLLRQR